MTCSRAGARHDMRDAVPPCGMRSRGEAGRRTRTPPQQPSGRGGPARADRHRNLHAPRLQNHPRITFRAPARSGPLQQIWTNGVAAAPGMGGTGRGDGPRAPPTPKRALRTRKCSSNRHSRVQSAPLECKMHISARKGPFGWAARVRAGRIPHSGRRIPETAPRARRTARSSRHRPSRHRPSQRRNPTRSRHAARRSDGLSPPMPDRAGFITLTG